MAEKADSFESDILEGFLCPICKADLKTLSRLKTHFQENHPEDQDVLKSLKDLFGKATKKILKLDESFTESVRKYEEFDIEPDIQEIGYIKSHTDRFKDIRCNKLEHYATQTNKLIIRLDQLLLVDSTDRRQHEQNIVPWLDGSTVKLCPQCAKSFNLTRRQHHCRLCGSIMCHGCTLFLNTYIAKSIITGIVTENDLIPAESESDSLRICSICMDMLNIRRRILLNRNTHPIICDFYSQLGTIKSKLEPQIELYKKMCTSLHAGETTFHLSDSQALKGCIGKQGEALDTVSKRIAAIPLHPDIPRAITLQNAIRRATATYIKDMILSLPALPTQAELQEKRKRGTNTTLQPKMKPVVAPRVLDGWSPEVTNQVAPESESDPILQQMDIVRGFIEQARKAHKYEEVATLEVHLKELEEAFYQQAVANSDLEKDT